jgi:hypothetical protein
MESYWKTLPFDIVTEILQFDGRIKRRKDSFVDQIDVNGDVYRLVRETLAKKVDAKKNMMIDGERYYIDIPLSIMFGVIYDNKWYGRETIVSFYRDFHIYYYTEHAKVC